jgi:hypothetical protein
MTHKPKFETLCHWDGTAGTGRQKMTQKDFPRKFVESLPRWWTKVYFSSALDWANKFLAQRNKIEIGWKLFRGDCFGAATFSIMTHAIMTLRKLG